MSSSLDLAAKLVLVQGAIRSREYEKEASSTVWLKSVPKRPANSIARNARTAASRILTSNSPIAPGLSGRPGRTVSKKGTGHTDNQFRRTVATNDRRVLGI